jgi:hypothetical protein
MGDRVSVLWCQSCALAVPPVHTKAAGRNEDGDPVCAHHGAIQKAEPVKPWVDKTCACGRKLYANNKTGSCMDCKKKPEKVAKQAKTLRQEAITGAAASSANPQVYPLRVTEAFLDKLWAQLLPEEKARLLETL